MALKEDKNKIKNGLYVVSTPIGNLRDITLRALDILKESNTILCEDTRVSRKLLSNYKIDNKTISYHKFNERKNLEKIINFLKEGQVVSLISDAGTPTISDPGKILIKKCIDEGIFVIPIPGPSAVISSLSISGFSDQFYFHGFLSETNNSINKEFEFLKSLKCSIVFFISAQKLRKRFDLLKKYFIEREILVCRELTKIHETFYRSKVSEVDKFEFTPKGEVTVIISEKKNDYKSDLNE